MINLHVLHTTLPELSLSDGPVSCARKHYIMSATSSVSLHT